MMVSIEKSKQVVKKVKLLTLTLFLFLLLPFSIYASTPIANYQMDSCSWNGTAGEVKDNSTDGINNSGTITGSTVKITKDGKIYNAGLFNGGAIDINDLNVSTTSGDKTTVAFWMYWDGTNSVMPFGWNRYDLWFYDGKFGFNTSAGDIYGIPDSSSLKNGWHHIVAVFTNGDYTQNKLYIDKASQTLTQQRNSQANSYAYVNSTARIGGWTYSNGYRFKSKIDELKIWNGELSASAIKSMYDNEMNGKNYDGSTRVSTCIEPIANYSMDSCLWNGTIGEVIDDSNNSFDGTAIGGASTESNTTVGGGICHVGNFIASSKQHIEIPNFPKISGSRTITVWIKVKDLAIGGRIFADDRNNQSGDYALSYGDPGSGRVRFYIRGLNAVSLDSDNVIVANQWYFVAARFDSIGMKKYLYIYDSFGNLKDSVSQTVAGTLNFSEGFASIGGEPSSGNEANGAQFDGNIDEVKIFDKVLIDNKINQIYSNEKDKKNYDGSLRSCPTCSPPIANYQMDSCSWNGTAGEVKDNSTDGINNSGTITGSTVKITKDGKIYNAGLFNGGAIDINDLNVSTTSGDKTTVAFWMYWDGTNSVMPFGWNRYDLWFYDGKFGFNTSAGDIYGIPDSSSLKNGWHHIVAVFTNGDYTQNKLYIDKASQTLTQQRNSQANSYAYVNSTARIGGWTYSNGYRFKSKIDELKIWNGELSASAIKSMYDNEMNGKNYDGSTRVSTCIEPIADYQFENCYYNGTVDEVKDSKGLYNGTSINRMISKYDSEKDDMFGRVAKFNGIDQRVKLNNFPHLDTSFTITAWFKTKNPTQMAQRIFIDDDNSHGYALSVGDNGVNIVRFYNRANGNDVLDTSGVVQANTWYFVAAVMDVESKTKYLYLYDINGTLVDEVSKNIDKFPLQQSTNDVYIGGVRYSNNTTYSFNGFIDKVLVYKQVLNKTQIEKILTNNLSKKQYNGADMPRYKICPVANYRLDDLCNSGGASFKVAESTGSNLDGVIKPDGDALMSKNAKVCSGAQFNGQNQYIDINDSDVLDNTQTLTTTAWIYPTELAQTNGTNARGIFSKRNGYSGNSQYAYGVFFWNGNNLSSTEAAIYVDIDSQNDRTYSAGKIKVNEWTHITIVFDGRLPQNERTKIYINGSLDSTHKETSSFVPDYSSDFYIGNLYSGTSELKVFKGIMDEVKIYDQALNSSDVSQLFTNENNGLDYTGVQRNCVCHETDKNVTFNAVDRIGGCFNWDNNIQTKIINDNINLTILARDENNSAIKDSNITKVELLDYKDTGCSNLINTTEIWSGNHQTNDLSSGCFELPPFTYNKATRCAKIRIYGKYTSKDINSTGTDNFAIRPLKFGVDFNTTSFYAGVPFHMNINAAKFGGGNSFDYNETNGTSFSFDMNDSNATCVSGVLGNFPNPFKFENGNISFDTNYSDVGAVKFNIKEINGSEFAFVDEDDTNDDKRLIAEYNTSITVKPYQFAIVDYDFKRNPNQDWRYMSDVLDSNISISFKVQAQNKNGQVTHKFDGKCYATDVNVSIDLNSTSNDGNVSYYKLLNNIPIYANDRNLSDFNLSGTINDQNFTDGNSSKVVYVLNVYRQFNKPKNPLDINVSDINTTYNIDTNVKNIGLIPDNNGSQFYYGRVKTKDINTNKQNTIYNLGLEVYSTNNNNYTNGFHQNSLNWYQMQKDNSTAMIGFYPKVGFTMQVDKSGLNNITGTQSTISGIVNFDIINSWNKTDSAYIHVKIPKYLWYSEYKDYNDSNNSDCSAHPCFKYNYFLDNNTMNIKSGDFNGTSIGSDYNASNVVKKGVKVFR